MTYYSICCNHFNCFSMLIVCNFERYLIVLLIFIYCSVLKNNESKVNYNQKNKVYKLIWDKIHLEQSTQLNFVN